MATYRDFLEAVLDSRIKTPYDRTADEIAAGVTPVNYAYPPGDVRRYGAVGDWNGSTGTDNLAAFNAAYAVALAKAQRDHGAEIFIPEGKFAFSDEWNIYRANSPRYDITIRGVDQLNTILVANFYGAGKALIKCVDPNGTRRASPVSIRDLGFENASTSGGINPLFVNILGWGESRMDRVRFGGSNNTHIRAVSMQNVRMTDVVSFFGGRHFNYKNTAGITFTVDTAANTITASSAIFSADDVGKHFFIFPDNVARRIRYTISGYTSPTVVSYSDSTDLAQTGVSGHFEPARCSISSGSTTLTANAACFTPDMVGLVIYVRGAAAGPYGAGLLRATITSYIAANQVELDVAAGNTVTDAYFAVACFDFGLPPGWAGSSDVQIDKLHIEHYDGVAFVAQNTDSYMVSGKIHGETNPTDSAKSMAACWLDDFGGKFEVNLDSSCSMSDCRIFACNFNDLTIFDAMWSRHIINGTLAKTDLFTDPGGYLVLRGLNMYDNAADPTDLLSDANYNANPADARILFEGVVNMLTDTAPARQYVGRLAYFLPDGRLIVGPTTVGANYNAAFSHASGVRMLFEATAAKRWSIGNTPGGGQNFVFRDESAGANRIEISGLTGALFPSDDATLDSGASGNRWRRTFTNVLAITAGVSAPAAIAGYAVLYVDSADGDLKVIFPDGTVKTIVTDN